MIRACAPVRLDHLSGSTTYQARSFDSDLHTACAQVDTVGNMNALISSMTSEASGENRQRSCSHITSSIASTPMYLDNKECPRCPLAALSSDRACRLLKMPQELRYRIYEFLFNNARFLFKTSKITNAVVFKNRDLPLAITATCHLIHDEVDAYLATFIRIKLIDNTTHGHFSIRDTIPERFLLRVICLKTSIDNMLDNFDITSTVPNLRELNVHLGVYFSRLPQDHAHNFLAGTEEIKGERVGTYVAECFESFQLPPTLVQQCRSRGIAIVFNFRSCQTKTTHEVEVIHDVEVRTEERSGEQTLRVVGKLQGDPKRYGGMLVADYLAYLRAPGFRVHAERGRSLDKHWALLERLLAA